MADNKSTETNNKEQMESLQKEIKELKEKTLQIENQTKQEIQSIKNGQYINKFEAFIYLFGLAVCIFIIFILGCNLNAKFRHHQLSEKDRIMEQMIDTKIKMAQNNVPMRNLDLDADHYFKFDSYIYQFEPVCVTASNADILAKNSFITLENGDDVQGKTFFFFVCLQ